jgi:hypothetical protein
VQRGQRQLISWAGGQAIESSNISKTELQSEVFVRNAQKIIKAKASGRALPKPKAEEGASLSCEETKFEFQRKASASKNWKEVGR